LSLEHKVAQMMLVPAAAIPQHPESVERRELLARVRELGVGGIVLFRSELDTLPELLNELQAAAKVPLWVGADVERSLGMRVPAGPVSLPDAMALGAIPGEAGIEAARCAGDQRETRAAGIHWVLAPVVDVNVNPANPIITRSLSEDRSASRLRRSSPGVPAACSPRRALSRHGDTAVDSHRAADDRL
jgi:beta-glucosidase